MHREAGDYIEEFLAGTPPAAAREHLDACAECREMVSSMQEHAALVRQLKPPAEFDAEPRPGFYARVMGRIEAEGPISIWNLFMDSVFGRRIAVASFALALLLGVYLVSTEQGADEPLIAGDPSAQILAPIDAVSAPGTISVSEMPSGVASTRAPIDPFAAQMEQFVLIEMNEMNQFMTHMEPGSPDGEALVDLVTYREQ